jgi:hypothetical protein
MKRPYQKADLFRKPKKISKPNVKKGWVIKIGNGTMTVKQPDFDKSLEGKPITFQEFVIPKPKFYPDLNMPTFAPTPGFAKGGVLVSADNLTPILPSKGLMSRDEIIGRIMAIEDWQAWHGMQMIFQSLHSGFTEEERKDILSAFREKENELDPG